MNSDFIDENKKEEWIEKLLEDHTLVHQAEKEGIGFDVRLGGARGLTYLQSNDHINYINYGQNAYFWCSDRIQADTVGVTRNIAAYTDKIMRMTTLFVTKNSLRYPVLYSVRCVKDKN